MRFRRRRRRNRYWSNGGSKRAMIERRVMGMKERHIHRYSLLVGIQRAPRRGQRLTRYACICGRSASCRAVQQKRQTSRMSPVACTTATISQGLKTEIIIACVRHLEKRSNTTHKYSNQGGGGLNTWHHVFKVCVCYHWTASIGWLTPKLMKEKAI